MLRTMANVVENERRCFTFIWKVENPNYREEGEDFVSPLFKVDEINGTKWELILLFYSYKDRTELQLRRRDDRAGKVEIDCEFAYLTSDGSVLHSELKEKSSVGKYESIGVNGLPSLYEAVCPSRNTLTVRCRIWISVGEISNPVQLFARTRVHVEKRTFLWDIQHFSSFVWDDKTTYEIASLESGGHLMCLELLIFPGQIYDERYLLKIIPNYKNFKTSTLKISTVDASKNNVLCFQGEFSSDIFPGSEYFTLFNSKEELIKKKSELLPNNVLSLLCECSFSSGKIVHEFEGDITNCAGVENIEPKLNKVIDLPQPIGILIGDLKPMFNNSVLSDVKLKTKNQTYPAHKFILGARSPVFKAMFSSDMKENTTDSVDIDDLNDETVLRMLRFIYCAEVEELEWRIAIELYEAADKYEILNLRDLCSSCMKTKLCPSNACEALVLADLHQDKDLKCFVQDFVLRNGKAVISSEEWDHLMETNLKLAAETMRRKYKDLAK